MTGQIHTRKILQGLLNISRSCSVVNRFRWEKSLEGSIPSCLSCCHAS